jgi:hypothetical protein
MGGRFAVHGNNYPGLRTEDLDVIQSINPGFVLLCQPDFNLVRKVRERIPGVTIIGRIFGSHLEGWDAWHPPYTDKARMREYGNYCRTIGELAGVDILQYANEPGIDDGDPSWWTPEGYQRLANGCAWFLEGWERSRVRLGTIPFSPGHQFDDGLFGAQYVRAVWQEHDVAILHTYWNRDPSSVTSEWYGGRWQRELTALHWEKDWAITEWNRDEPTIPGDAERWSLAEDSRRWFASLPTAGRFLGAAFFIWHSGDPGFARLQMFDNPPLIQVAKDVNAQIPQPPVDIPPPGEEPPPPQGEPMPYVLPPGYDAVYAKATQIQSLTDQIRGLSVELKDDLLGFEAASVADHAEMIKNVVLDRKGDIQVPGPFPKAL